MRNGSRKKNCPKKRIRGKYSSVAGGPAGDVLLKTLYVRQYLQRMTFCWYITKEKKKEKGNVGVTGPVCESLRCVTLNSETTGASFVYILWMIIISDVEEKLRRRNLITLGGFLF